MNIQIKNFLEKIIYSNETVIIFESPKRLKKLLLTLIENIPSRKIAVIRELTKKNEEVVYKWTNKNLELLNIRRNGPF